VDKRIFASLPLLSPKRDGNGQNRTKKYAKDFYRDGALHTPNIAEYTIAAEQKRQASQRSMICGRISLRGGKLLTARCIEDGCAGTAAPANCATYRAYRHQFLFPRSNCHDYKAGDRTARSKWQADFQTGRLPAGTSRRRLRFRRRGKTSEHMIGLRENSS
jgi:hypothetical protein